MERAHSQGTAVTGINGSYTSATQFNYTSPGFIPTSDFPSSSSYNVVFGTAGTVNNDFVLDSTASFIAGSSFDLVQKADELRVRRNSVSSIGNKEVIGVEHLTLPSTTNGATVEIRNSRLKSLALEMNSLQLNLSGDQTFVNNTTGLSWSNVERLDYLFHAGLQTSTPNNSGFGVFERGGNDGFKIAAILALDLSGDPSILGPILTISSGSFGPALRPLDQTIMVKEDADVNYRPAQNLTGQSVHGIYISFDDLGIAADQLFYGYALLGTDVTANSINWNDNSVYPNSTGPSVGIDLCPGGGVFSSDGGLIASSVDSDGDGYADDVDIDDDNDGLRDVTECPDIGKPRIYNDDFEGIDIVTSGLDGGPSDVVSTAGIWKGDASNIPNWESSDVVNNHLEIWHHSQAASDDAGGTPYSGAQWAEINATTNDGIYQDIPTTPGDTIQ
ncbi:MAG: hypothetical protein HKO93_04325, partial [Flavobacteriales bacterium]|nr:hypothetical protein [Flavobacteriales bacterium]